MTTEYKKGIVDDAKRILGLWYKNNPERLQQRVDAIETWNAEHSGTVNPYRYLLAAHDAGAKTPDGVNHKVFGAGWANHYGVDKKEISALANSVKKGEIVITSESVAAFESIDPLVGMKNQVGSVPGIKNFTYSDHEGALKGQEPSVSSTPAPQQWYYPGGGPNGSGPALPLSQEATGQTIASSTSATTQPVHEQPLRGEEAVKKANANLVNLVITSTNKDSQAFAQAVKQARDAGANLHGDALKKAVQEERNRREMLIRRGAGMGGK